MFINLIRKIRQKPKHEREKYALLFASVFTGMIALVWSAHVFSKDYSLRDSGDKERPSMFSGLIKQSKDQLASVRGAIGQDTASENDETEVIVENTRKEISINLSAEDIELARERMNSGYGDYSNDSEDDFETPTSTATVSDSQNYQYQEIQIVTVPSTSSTSSQSSQAEAGDGSNTISN